MYTPLEQVYRPMDGTNEPHRLTSLGKGRVDNNETIIAFS